MSGSHWSRRTGSLRGRGMMNGCFQLWLSWFQSQYSSVKMSDWGLHSSEKRLDYCPDSGMVDWQRVH